MKTYISVGIGDMMALDAMLTQDERDRITDFYWACKFGESIYPLFDCNHFYPNLEKHYFIDKEEGEKHMMIVDPRAINFWHFRPDFPLSFQIGLNLFGLNREDLNVIDAVKLLSDPSRTFTNSSFLDVAKLEEVNWKELGVDPGEYILVHYPTSTRPRSDIASLDERDWNFIEKLSEDTKLRILIITDTDIHREIKNSSILIKPDIKSIVSLCKFSKFYAGCDSFVSILCCKVLSPENMFIKTHDRDIYNSIMHNTFVSKHFLPHSPDIIRTFYKNYIGY